LAVGGRSPPRHTTDKGRTVAPTKPGLEPEEDLAGRVALVTGGGTGIGAAISAGFVARGASVVICHEDQALADELATKAGAGERIIGVGADLATARGCHEVVQRTLAVHGRVDFLVNNAGVTGRPALGPFLEFSDEHLDLVVDVNLKAVFRCCREAARWMSAAGQGVIVNIASVAAFAAQQHAAAYVAAKAGVVGLTRSLAFELASSGIRVVAVAPGDIDVGARSWSTTQEDTDPGWWTRRTPLGRRGLPIDVASVVMFLCSDGAGFITGETVVVDGGLLTY
jgi:NAD(P)-dependent dehydrogenase (short-subunit alcohol dehydrogenase family)